ncbi:hypothetical protein [Aureimonas sp. AU4]|uniref:hypothetical protein n=1 Tax=Aureimonas sp. AU4 TaxID=1638163 RepID=UPI0007068A31|nr:hypothetical protein [Aureimonas sp. AU4]BAT30645.1 LuxR family transcription regulator [Aureimonas sp. AU4]
MRNLITIARTRDYEGEERRREILDASRESEAAQASEDIKGGFAAEHLMAEETTAERTELAVIVARRTTEPAVVQVHPAQAADEAPSTVRHSLGRHVPNVPSLVVVPNDAMSSEKTHVSGGSEDLWEPLQPIVNVRLP